MRFFVTSSIALMALVGSVAFADGVVHLNGASFDPADNPNGMCGASNYGYVVNGTTDDGQPFNTCVEAFVSNFKFNGFEVLDKSGSGKAFDRSVMRLLNTIVNMDGLSATINDNSDEIMSVDVKSDKICGITKINGIKNFVYATIGGVQVTGRTYDPLNQLKDLKENQVNCVCGKLDLGPKNGTQTLAYLTNILSSSNQVCN